jgi:hypothetical protein
MTANDTMSAECPADKKILSIFMTAVAVAIGGFAYCQHLQIDKLERENDHLLRRDFNKNIAYRD